MARHAGGLGGRGGWVVTYRYGFVYGHGGPVFDFGDLRHDDGSASRRADEMQSRRTKKGGVRQVTRGDTYSRRKVLKA